MSQLPGRSRLLTISRAIEECFARARSGNCAKRLRFRQRPVKYSGPFAVVGGRPAFTSFQRTR